MAGKKKAKEQFPGILYVNRIDDAGEVFFNGYQGLDEACNISDNSKIAAYKLVEVAEKRTVSEIKLPGATWRSTVNG